MYAQSFLKSSGTDDLHKRPTRWHRQILTQIFDLLLPSIFHTLLSQCTAMLLYYFTPTAADIPFFMETCFPILSSDSQRLSSSVHSARGQFDLRKACERWSTVWPEKNSLQKNPNPKALQVMKLLSPLVPVEHRVPHKMHLYAWWVQWVEFTSSVKNVAVVLSVLTTAELHTCA